MPGRFKSALGLQTKSVPEPEEYRVVYLKPGVPPDPHGRSGGMLVQQGGRIRCAGSRTESTDVAEYGTGIRLVVAAVPVVVRFETIGRIGIHDVLVPGDHTVLYHAAEAMVGVEVVVLGGQTNQVPGIDRPAEPFVGIVTRVGYLDIVDLRGVPYRTQGESVYLLARGHFVARELDADILQLAGVVMGIAAAIGGFDSAFGNAFPSGDVVGRLTTDHQSAPVAV